MKRIFSLIVQSLFSLVLINAQQPWQKISYPGTRELVANFKTPPPEYGMILWWGWDGPMTDTVIKRDLDRIKAMGFQGVMLEAGYGMTAKYLSPEWFAMVKIAVGEAKKRDMRVWIEDEGKYPSGFAGGKFSNERPDLKMQGLVITEKIDTQAGEKIARKLPYYALSAVAYNNEDKTSKRLDVTSGELNWQAPEGNWRIFIAGHRFRSSVTRSVNNPARGKDTTASLMDYLNPLATRQFLIWTHEQYKKYIGKEFGKTFMGFMGDEHDFDFIDEQALASVLSPENGTLINFSKQAYSAIIVPSISVTSQGSLEKLKKFADAGGIVIFMEKQPELVIGKSFYKAGKTENMAWAKIEITGKITPAVLNSLPPSDVKLDKFCSDIKYQHRRLKDAEGYFIFNEGKAKQSFEITLSGKGNPQVWDAMTGEIKKLQKFVKGEGKITLPLDFEPYETIFIIIGK